MGIISKDFTIRITFQPICITLLTKVVTIRFAYQCLMETPLVDLGTREEKKIGQLESLIEMQLLLSHLWIKGNYIRAGSLSLL